MSPAASPLPDGPSRLRLDKWLWHARFFRTRSLAARFIEAARIRMDGRVVDRPSAAVVEGAVLTFPLGDRVRVVQVLKLGERRGPAPEARTLYAELGDAGERDGRQQSNGCHPCTLTAHTLGSAPFARRSNRL